MDIANISTQRAEKFQDIIAKRQQFTVILENVHDPHNIGAVIRSCDAVGIHEVFILYTEDSHNFSRKKVGKNTSTGTRKWVKSHFYDDIDECFTDVRSRYSAIWGTHLSEGASSLYDLDLTLPVALLFGNEHTGISEAALSKIDGNFVIPQYGMVQSLNISVACAVTLFEALRQRRQIGHYNLPFDADNDFQKEMFSHFVSNHFDYKQKNEK
jgi:tRNA (guanosine-2'-O-)-methyltransferase